MWMKIVSRPLRAIATQILKGPKEKLGLGGY